MSWKEEKRQQRRKEDKIVNILLWTCVLVIAGSAGITWYMMIRFMYYLEDFVSYTAGLM